MKEHSIEKSEPCILIEEPRWADAEFYGKWLLAAAKAEALWTEALEDPIFQKQVERLTIIYLPDFSITATVMMSQLKKNLVSFAIQLNSEEAADLVDAFVMMGLRPWPRPRLSPARWSRVPLSPLAECVLFFLSDAFGKGPGAAFWIGQPPAVLEGGTAWGTRAC
jgi:hypothetical protein